MQRSRTLDQQIAVFGEAGSGKTVLLSSFYGATQEPSFQQDHLFDVIADDIGQGTRLHRNYLGMRDAATPPAPTHFAAASYGFSVKLKEPVTRKEQKARPFDALRVTWHDYPGEWFEQSVSGPEEERRREELPGYRMRLRVSVVTARSAPAHERALWSLREWGLRVNDAFFLGGIAKGPILETLRPHIFFDDQQLHLTSESVPSVHIPFGVRNAEPQARPRRAAEPEDSAAV